MTVLEVLTGPEKWCKFEIAMNQEGDRVHPNSSCAQKWCLLGAVRKAYGPLSHRAIGKILSILPVADHDISTWNDDESRTFDQVVDVVRRAGI